MTAVSEAKAAQLAASVVICAYTLERWDTIRAAVDAVLAQEPRPAQVIVVCDHNPELARRAKAELPGVTVLDSAGARGLSGARNTGLAAATSPVTAFLDDDAVPRPGWLAALLAPYERGNVVATGGHVEPRWAGRRPAWLPPEFDWVVGCSYAGMPAGGGPIRNPIGASMSMRTDLALAAGGFDDAVGRVGARPTGCEETELSIRLTAATPGSAIYYEPASVVDHLVTAQRASYRYFLRRCWHEGNSKARVVALAGAGPGLERERRQAAVVIPRALARQARQLAAGHPAAAARMAALASGLAVTAAGYLTGQLRRAAGRARGR